MSRSVICMIAAAALLFAAPARAQYNVLHGHVCNGGGVRSGGGYGVHDTAGQPLTGITMGPSNAVKGGFWYCAWISSTVDVAFVAFFAELRNDAVILAWEAGSSASFEGFHVYRSETNDDEFARITSVPVAAGSEAEYRDETALAGKTYFYRIGALSGDGEWFSPTLSVSIPPKPTMLFQNYPNPFNPNTSIAFHLATCGRITLAIYDMRGARVRMLVDAALAAGRHVETWDGRNDAGKRVSSGVYSCRLQAGKEQITKKLVLLR